MSTIWFTAWTTMVVAIIVLHPLHGHVISSFDVNAVGKLVIAVFRRSRVSSLARWYALQAFFCFLSIRVVTLDL